jgi:hypothetical protein
MRRCSMADEHHKTFEEMLSEPLDSVMTIRLSVAIKTALREISKYYGTSEGEMVRRMLATLATAYHDARSQVTLGTSFDDLLSRSTRLTLAQFMNTPPADLRRMADEFSRAAYALADLIERG